MENKRKKELIGKKYLLKRVPAPRPEWSSFLLGGIAPWAVAAWQCHQAKKAGMEGG